jgi:hypothetical protein
VKPPESSSSGSSDAGMRRVVDDRNRKSLARLMRESLDELRAVTAGV